MPRFSHDMPDVPWRQWERLRQTVATWATDRLSVDEIWEYLSTSDPFHTDGSGTGLLKFPSEQMMGYEADPLWAMAAHHPTRGWLTPRVARILADRLEYCLQEGYRLLASLTWLEDLATLRDFIAALRRAVAADEQFTFHPALGAEERYY
jgi:hypothetical protein